MGYFKNVYGEKAYIGNINNCFTDILLVNSYTDPKPILEKICAKEHGTQGIEFCEIKIKNVHNIIADGECGNEKEGNSYIICIGGVPLKEAFRLPDWKD